MLPRKRKPDNNLQKDTSKPNETMSMGKEDLAKITTALLAMMHSFRPNTEGCKVITPTKYKAENMDQTQEANSESVSNPSVSNPSGICVFCQTSYTVSCRPRSSVSCQTINSVSCQTESSLTTQGCKVIIPTQYKAKHTGRTRYNQYVEEDNNEIINNPSVSSVSNLSVSTVSNQLGSSASNQSGSSVPNPSGSSISNSSRSTVSNPSGSSTSNQGRKVILPEKNKAENTNRTRCNQSVEEDLSEDEALMKDAMARKVMRKMFMDNLRHSLSNPSGSSVSNPSGLTTSDLSGPSVSNPSVYLVSNPSRPCLSNQTASSVPIPLGHSIFNPSGSSVHNPSGSFVSNPSAPSASNPSGSSVSNPSGSAVSNPSGPSVSNPSRPSRSNTRASSVSEPLGHSISNPAGCSVSRPSGLSVSNSTGSPVSNPSGSSVSNPSGPSISSPSLSSVSNAARPSLSNPSGSYVSNPTGSAVSNASQSSVSNPSGPSVSNQGDGDGYPANCDDEEFSSSDDNSFINHKRNKEVDIERVPIGSGETSINRNIYEKINWESLTLATRSLLKVVFPSRILATHTLTGHQSPAIQNKSPKMYLDPKKISDIIMEIMKKFKVPESIVRNIISIECADKSKRWTNRGIKRNPVTPQVRVRKIWEVNLETGQLTWNFDDM